ncbi:MAG: GNAT family N-acetyltransferase [Pseudomonadota bacterium]
MLSWQWDAWHQLKADDVHAMLALRQTVFIVEQQCFYLDIDDADQRAFHLLGWQNHACESAPGGQRRVLAAYLRVLPPGVKYIECALGRVVTAPSVRGTGLGRLLMAEGLRWASEQFAGLPIKISAQLRLQRFYEHFGFAIVSMPYDEDGIVHVEMLREPGLLIEDRKALSA